MKQVDYAKLSEQYASFLVAAGGVSITVLALVLGLPSVTKTPEQLSVAGQNAQVYLVAALITATVSCFIGAHMMAETAAFFTQNGDEPPKRYLIPLGRRLFVLATSNIFIAITLILFSIVLLPTATGKADLADKLKWISVVVFMGVVVGALCWMVLAAFARMAVGEEGGRAIAYSVGAGLMPLILFLASRELWPKLTFIFIISCTSLSLVYFAVIFKRERACTKNFAIREIAVFSSAITISYSFLLIAFWKILWGS
jgi:hypothetical protein